VDDERLARERLLRLLAAHTDVEIVGEAEDGEQAIARILGATPHLVFLDIQMPGCTGLEVAASLRTPRPHIVFCTAYDEYAVDAFEVNAVDYLLKPVSQARLAAALERVRAGLGQSRAAQLDGGRVGWPLRFLGKRGTHFGVVPREEVLYFATENGLTKLQGRGGHYWMQPTLAELELRLDPASFFRISRAAIVNLEAIRELIPEEGGHARARLADGTVLPVSRRRVSALVERLSRG
jgi:DNA-binding LytR/AlgR family response regulator